MSEEGPFVVLIAEKDGNSYYFSEDRETAEILFSKAKSQHENASSIIFGSLTIIGREDHAK
jgi:hypothetical protein